MYWLQMGMQSQLPDRLTHCKHMFYFKIVPTQFHKLLFLLLRFGSKFRSPSTGIILNDSMDDFSVPGRTNAYGLPASPANFIRPQKMPLSSMSPSILIDGKGDAELIVGAAGGSKITSSIAYVCSHYITRH